MKRENVFLRSRVLLLCCPIVVFIKLVSAVVNNSKRSVKDPVNMALFSADVYMKCDLEGEKKVYSFSIDIKGKDITLLFNTEL